MKLRFATLLLASTLLAVSNAPAQRGDALPVRDEVMSFDLEKEQLRDLNEEAEEYYRSSLNKADHVDYFGAVNDLSKAAAAQPLHIDLQFLLVKNARKAAEISYGEDSVRFYDYAESALRRLLANPDLGPNERARARRESERVRSGKDAVRARDKQRNDTGFELVKQIHHERLIDNGLTKKQGTESIADVLKGREKKDTIIERINKSEIWGVLGAPGLNTPEAQQAAAGTATAVAGAAPATAFGTPPPAAGAAPAGANQTFQAKNPFESGGAGGAGDPFSSAGSADPFAGGGGASDPFAGGGAQDPFSAGGF